MKKLHAVSKTSSTRTYVCHKYVIWKIQTRKKDPKQIFFFMIILWFKHQFAQLLRTSDGRMYIFDYTTVNVFQFWPLRDQTLVYESIQVEWVTFIWMCQSYIFIYGYYGVIERTNIRSTLKKYIYLNIWYKGFTVFYCLPVFVRGKRRITTL